MQIIDLVVPRGPQGERGAAGRDASVEDIRKIVIEVLSSDEMRSAFRGENGASGRDGNDSTVPGPRGDVGPQGLSGAKGDSPTKEELRALIRQVIDERPEQFRGPMCHPGREGRGGVGLRGAFGKPGDISAAFAQAEREARNVVEEALAGIEARLQRLESAK